MGSNLSFLGGIVLLDVKLEHFDVSIVFYGVFDHELVLVYVWWSRCFFFSHWLLPCEELV